MHFLLKIRQSRRWASSRLTATGGALLRQKRGRYRKVRSGKRGCYSGRGLVQSIRYRFLLSRTHVTQERVCFASSLLFPLWSVIRLSPAPSNPSTPVGPVPPPLPFPTVASSESGGVLPDIPRRPERTTANSNPGAQTAPLINIIALSAVPTHSAAVCILGSDQQCASRSINNPAPPAPLRCFVAYPASPVAPEPCAWHGCAAVS